ncbi:DUF6308 family protein [Streptomyces sp. NPDC054783]
MTRGQRTCSSRTSLADARAATSPALARTSSAWAVAEKPAGSGPGIAGMLLARKGPHLIPVHDIRVLPATTDTGAGGHLRRARRNSRCRPADSTGGPVGPSTWIVRARGRRPYTAPHRRGQGDASLTRPLRPGVDPLPHRGRSWAAWTITARHPSPLPAPPNPTVPDHRGRVQPRVCQGPRVRT